MYDEAGRGFVTEQAGGSGTMGGPPARGRTFDIVAGSAVEIAANVAARSTLLVVKERMSNCGEYGSERSLTDRFFECRMMRCRAVTITFEAALRFIDCQRMLCLRKVYAGQNS